jgi:hypothetical protein
VSELSPLTTANRIIHEVSVAHTVIGLIALVAHAFFIDELTSSHILRVFILGGVSLGGPIGYFRTALVWAGKGRPKCQKRGMLYFSLWLVFLLLLVVSPIEVLKPVVVQRIPTLEPVREWLLTLMLLTNMIIFIGSFLSSFFLVGAITLCSAKLANPRS